MLLDSFFRYLDARGPHTRTRRRRAAHARSVSPRLLLEQLEDRALPSFLAPLSFDVGTTPESVAVGDFNRDGRPDLAAANRSSNNVSVLLSNGDGTFQAARHFATGATAISVAVGDFNRDNRPDLAVAIGGSSGNVSVLLGNGDGSFQAPRNFAVGSIPTGVAVGDFNRDALPDLAVASFPVVSVLLGNGDGTFQAARPFDTGRFHLSVAVADFNADAIPDLATGSLHCDDFECADPAVRVLLGNGDGTFQAARSFTVASEPRSVAVGDFNGDTRPDLVVANTFFVGAANGQVSVLLGNGDGTFGPVRTFDVGWDPVSVAVGEFNGDGRPDLAVTNSFSRNVSVLQGRGDGTFQAARHFPAGGAPHGVVAADVNGDGCSDLAVTSRHSDSVSVLLGNGDGTLQAAPSFAAGADSRSVAVADLNGDGRPDLAVTGQNCDFGCFDGTVRVLLGNSDGTFQAPRIFAAGSGPHSVAVADFNRDGRPDLAVAGYGLQCDPEGVCIIVDEFVSVLLGNGDGTFQAASGFSAGSEPTSVAVGDFNGDSRPDLAVANNGSNNVSVLLGNGDGTFQAPRNFAVGGAPNSVAVADLNGDGRPDLATANRSINTVSVLLGNGDGTFQIARNFPTGLGGSAVAVADVNGDGRPDLAVAGSGGVSVLLGNGDGTFQPPRNFAAGLQPSSVAVGEFNGDGFLDIGVVSSGGVRVLRGNGDGTFQTTHVSYVAGAAPISVAVGNFNGDGRADLAVAGGSGVSILLNNTILTVTSFTPTPTGLAIQFNRSFDPGALNLYDTASAGLGPADVTLMGSTTGPVTGSLVVQAASNRITFVRTGGVLPPDTYTVTLRSAANGFRTLGGALLDGNGDGTPGGNYVTTFTVAASSTVTVSLPDFTRGPGQPVNVPADRTGLPLRLSNGSGVTAVSLTLAYDPALLRITSAAVAAGLPAGATVALNTATAGLAVLTFNSPTPLPAGPRDFVTLTAAVPDSAPYGAKQVLNLNNLTVNGAAARDDDGMHLVGYFGDTTGNAGYSSSDASRVLRVAIGLDSGFDAWQLADPVLVADVTGNGTLNTTDATRILQEALGLDRPEIPPPGSAPPFTPGGPDPFLNIPKHYKAGLGEVVTVPVLLDVSEGLESADLAISFDPTRLEVLKVQRGNLTSDFDLFAVNTDTRDGTLRVGLARSAGSLSDRGSGSVIEITFRVREKASAGPVVINLRQRIGPLMTQLNEGWLDLIPDSSDEEGDVLDGLLTVVDQGPAVKKWAAVTEAFFRQLGSLRRDGADRAALLQTLLRKSR